MPKANPNVQTTDGHNHTVLHSAVESTSKSLCCNVESIQNFENALKAASAKGLEYKIDPRVPEDRCEKIDIPPQGSTRPEKIDHFYIPTYYFHSFRESSGIGTENSHSHSLSLSKKS